MNSVSVYDFYIKQFRDRNAERCGDISEKEKAESLRVYCVRCQKNRNASAKTFLLKVSQSSAYYVALMLYGNSFGVILSEEDRAELNTQLESHYRRSIDRIGAELDIDSCEELAEAMAYCAITDNLPLFAAAAKNALASQPFEEWASSKFSLPENYFQRVIHLVFLRLANSYDGFHLSAWFCRSLHDYMEQRQFVHLLLSMGSRTYRVNIDIPENQRDPDLDLLIGEGVKTGRLPLLYALEHVYRSINMTYLSLDEDDLIRMLFLCDNSSDFYLGIRLFTDLVRKRYGEPDELRNAFEKLACTPANKSPQWMMYKNWFLYYALSFNIRADINRAEELMADFATDPDCSTKKMFFTESMCAIVMPVVEEMMLHGMGCIVSYLKLIEPINPCSEKVYSFRPHVEFHESRIERSRIVPVLREAGYSDANIVYIYFNSHFRAILDIHTFLKQLSPARRAKLSTNIDVYDIGSLFYKYPLVATYRKRPEAKNGAFMINAICKNIQTFCFENDWLKANQGYIRDAMQPDCQYIVRLTGWNTLTARVTVTPDINREELEQYSDKIDWFVECMNIFTEIEHTRTITPLQNSALLTLPKATNDSFEQKVRIQLQVLRCCSAIAESEEAADENVRTLIRIINNFDFPVKNIYRHNNGRTTLPFERYEKSVFSEVITNWMRLKKSSLSFEHLFFVYINTILKHCVTLSTLMSARFPNDGSRIRFDESLLGEYTNYWFSGKFNGKNESRTEIYVKPEDFNTYSARFGFDKFIYYTNPHELARYIDDEYCFQLDYYISGTNTFVLKNFVKPRVRQTLPAEALIYALKQLAHTDEIDINCAADLTASGVTFSAKSLAVLANALAPALQRRLTRPADADRLLTLMYDNNPFRFGLSKVANSGMIAADDSKRMRELMDALVQTGNTELCARIYFNSPLRAVLPVEMLFRKINFGESDAQLVRAASKYPLTIRDGACVNCCAERSFEFDGTVHIVGFEDDRLICEPFGEDFAEDYSSEARDRALRQLRAYLLEKSKEIFADIQRTRKVTKQLQEELWHVLDFGYLTEDNERYVDFSLQLFAAYVKVLAYQSQQPSDYETPEDEVSADQFFNSVSSIANHQDRPLMQSVVILLRNGYALSEQQSKSLKRISEEYLALKPAINRAIILYKSTVFRYSFSNKEQLKKAVLGEDYIPDRRKRPGQPLSST